MENEKTAAWTLNDPIEVAALKGAVQARAAAQAVLQQAEAALTAVMSELKARNKIQPAENILLDFVGSSAVLKAQPKPPERAPEAIQLLEKAKRKTRG